MARTLPERFLQMDSNFCRRRWSILLELGRRLSQLSSLPGSARSLLSSHVQRGILTGMDTPSREQLAQKKCVACEGGVPPLERSTIEALLLAMPEWTLSPDGKRIRRKWPAED